MSYREQVKVRSSGGPLFSSVYNSIEPTGGAYIGDSTITDVERGTALVKAANAATGNEMLYLGPGTYDIGSSTLDLGQLGTAGLGLTGCGIDVTKIVSATLALPANVIVAPGTGSCVSNLTIQGTATDGTYQAPFGFTGVYPEATNVNVYNCKITSDSDCYSQTSGVAEVSFYNCVFASKYDVIKATTDAGSVINIYNCSMNAIGPFPTGTEVCRAVYINTGTVNLTGCTIYAGDGDGGDLGVFCLSGTANLYACDVTTKAGGTDFLRASGTINVDSATRYDVTKTTGTITKLPSYGGRAESVTAITGGKTTGLIKGSTSLVAVTSDSADKQISLPAASIGDVLNILTDGTGCELISVTAADKVNNVTVGATNELALAANTFFTCEYVAANTWLVRGTDNVGVDVGALVPDAL